MFRNVPPLPRRSIYKGYHQNPWKLAEFFGKKKMEPFFDLRFCRARGQIYVFKAGPKEKNVRLLLSYLFPVKQSDCTALAVLARMHEAVAGQDA